MSQAKHRERKEASERYIPKPDSIPMLVCHCRSFRFSHSPEEHKKQLRTDYDWRSWQEIAQSAVEYFEERVR